VWTQVNAVRSNFILRDCAVSELNTVRFNAENQYLVWFTVIGRDSNGNILPPATVWVFDWKSDYHVPNNFITTAFVNRYNQTIDFCSDVARDQIPNYAMNELIVNHYLYPPPPPPGMEGMPPANPTGWDNSTFNLV